MTELERFRIILVTICLEHPEMEFREALLLADELMIKARVEFVTEGIVAKSINDTTPPPVIDAWLHTQLDIKTFEKIKGIKEIRARTSLRLSDAKAAWERVFLSAP